MLNNPQAPTWRRKLRPEKQHQFSLLRRMAISACFGISVAAVGIVLQAFTEGHPIIAIESLDNISTAILTALLVFAYEQKRYRAAMEKVRIIAEMNHHVRNALQAIVSCKVLPEQERQVKMIAESVTRIEWALRKVLPGGTDARAA
jgi:hypothetical protein